MLLRGGTCEYSNHEVAPCGSRWAGSRGHRGNARRDRWVRVRVDAADRSTVPLTDGDRRPRILRERPARRRPDVSTTCQQLDTGDTVDFTIARNNCTTAADSATRGLRAAPTVTLAGPLRPGRPAAGTADVKPTLTDRRSPARCERAPRSGVKDTFTVTLTNASLGTPGTAIDVSSARRSAAIKYNVWRDRAAGNEARRCASLVHSATTSSATRRQRHRRERGHRRPGRSRPRPVTTGVALGAVDASTRSRQASLFPARHDDRVRSPRRA